MKQNFISGTLLLTLTGILSRIIGFYYKIFLSRRIGAEGLGIYQLIFPVFALIISVSAPESRLRSPVTVPNADKNARPEPI